MFFHLAKDSAHMLFFYRMPDIKLKYPGSYYY